MDSCYSMRPSRMACALRAPPGIIHGAALTRHAIPAHWPLYGVASCFIVHLLTYDALSTGAFAAACLWGLATSVSAVWCLYLRQWRRALLMALPGLFLALMLGPGGPVRERISDWGTALRFMVHEQRYRAQVADTTTVRAWVLGQQGPVQYQIIFDPRAEAGAQTPGTYRAGACHQRKRPLKPPFYIAAISC
jgi:hypothetical protein